MPMDEGGYKDYESVLNDIKKKASADNKELVEEEKKLKLQLEDECAKQERNNAVSLVEEINRLKINNIITNAAEEFAVAQSYINKQENNKKKAELATLKEINALNQKQLEKENKKLDNQIKTQEKINTLRSKTYVDETTGEVVEKTKGQQVKDNLAANFKTSISGLGDNLKKNLENLGDNFTKSITNLGNQINNTISTYANYRSGINARLQGSAIKVGNTTVEQTFTTLSDTLDSVAFSGLLTAEDLYSNLQNLVSSGISANVAQLSLLQTVKDDIAPTFNVTQRTLRQLVRVQQEDSTAARMGMEAYLTRFLNNFVETTEYLTDTFDSVADALYEASSLMGSAQSSEFEYIVQKWIGVLSGVGLSASTASSIATAIGQLGSGNISLLSSSDMQNLIVMAASRSGTSYAELLSNGLTASSVNTLLYNLVDFLQELNDSSQSNIVKSQLASTFGVNISDLEAVSNLTQTEMSSILKNTLSISQMYGELYDQFDSLTERLGTAKILENLFKNYTFSTGMNIANNPALYAAWKINDLVESATGGINIPFVTTLGTGIDVNANVNQLAKLVMVGISTLGGIGDIINGIGSVFNGSSLLTALNITNGNEAISRGNGLVSSNRVIGSTTSISSEMTANAAGSDYYEQTINSAVDSTQEELNQKLEETESTLDFLEKECGTGGLFREIHDSIESIASEGVNVKNLSDFSSSIAGFY